MRYIWDPTGARDWKMALVWMIGLGGIFTTVYLGTNWVTDSRSDVGVIYFAWERRIPFIPEMIVPYLSLDFLFAGALFVCRSNAELLTVVKRVGLAIAVSAAGFLLVPLRLAFGRPEISGIWSVGFAVLDWVDRPYNLAPSLHISLCALLWPVYRQTVRGGWRYLLGGWFWLIGISTLFVYQHHFMDLITGMGVALFGFYLVPGPVAVAERRRRSSGSRREWNRDVGILYSGIGCVGLAAAAAGPPIALWLVWPGLAMAIVGWAYLRPGPWVFRKARGKVPLSARLILAPFLLGCRISFWGYTWGRPAYAAIAPSVLIGRRLSAREAVQLLRSGVVAVLDMTAEYSECAPFRRVQYRNLPLLDLTAPTLNELRGAVRFIRESGREGRVYVHCALGYSRSACVVAAYLMEESGLNWEQAIQRLKNRRPELMLNEVQIRALQEWQAAIMPAMAEDPARP